MTTEQINELEKESVNIVYNNILPLLDGKPYFQCLSIMEKLKDALEINTTFNLDKSKAAEYQENNLQNIDRRYS